LLHEHGVASRMLGAESGDLIQDEDHHELA
jgi:hypothetical protein